MIFSQAEKFVVQEVPASEIIETDVFYLNTKFCLVKIWIDTKPHSNASLSSGVADSGDLSIIQRDLIPEQHKILSSPCNPKFHDIGNIIIDMQDYIILPIYLSNTAVILGDISEARVLCLSMEFQVVE